MTWAMAVPVIKAAALYAKLPGRKRDFRSVNNFQCLVTLSFEISVSTFCKSHASGYPKASGKNELYHPGAGMSIFSRGFALTFSQCLQELYTRHTGSIPCFLCILPGFVKEHSLLRLRSGRFWNLFFAMQTPQNFRFGVYTCIIFSQRKSLSPLRG